jgi:hypothetical protein
MNENYCKRIQAHNKAIDDVTWELLGIAERLCPGEWVLQISRNMDMNTHERLYTAFVSNGDDNITGHGKTIAAALSDLINYLIQGSLYPLAGGNNGMYIHPSDRGWVKKDENE